MKPYWMSKVIDEEIVQIKSSTYIEDVVECSQFKRDGTSIETISMKGENFHRFGQPVFDTTEIYEVDLNTQKCTMVNGGVTPLLGVYPGSSYGAHYSDFDFVTQSCVDFYFPTAYNSFRLENIETYL